MELVYELNAKKGVTLDTWYFSGLIEENSDDFIAYYNRGLANLSMGNYHDASSDLETAYSLGMQTNEARAKRGYARFKVGDSAGSHGELNSVVVSEPGNALFNVYLGEFLTQRGELSEALKYLNNANTINGDLGIEFLARSQLFLSQGLAASAESVIKPSVDLPLPSVGHYVDRSEILAFFGQYGLALSDIDQALRINPNRALTFSSRAGTYAMMGQFALAISDLTSAIKNEPADPVYRLRRGVLYHLLNKAQSAADDFETALSLGAKLVPLPVERHPSYFAVYSPPD